MASGAAESSLLCHAFHRDAVGTDPGQDLYDLCNFGLDIGTFCAGTQYGDALYLRCPGRFYKRRLRCLFIQKQVLLTAASVGMGLAVRGINDILRL